jgi:RNA polymerase sigma-70 factor (ECF subfamily)
MQPRPISLLGAESADPELPARLALERGRRERALELLMDLYGRDIHRYCSSLLGDEVQADDLLQTVFLEAFQHLGAWEGRASLKTWLFGIARHRCLDDLRRRKRWRRVFHPFGEPEAADASAPEADRADELDAPALSATLEDCLQRLGPEARDAVVLRFRHEVSYEEASVMTGQTAGALRVRVCRAVVALRRCLGRKGVQP